MRRCNPVVRQRLVHVLVDQALCWVRDLLPLGEHHEMGEALVAEGLFVTGRLEGLNDFLHLLPGHLHFLLHFEELDEVVG